MDYANTYQGNNAQSALGQPSLGSVYDAQPEPVGELEVVTGRIDQAIHIAYSIASNLGNHADRLRGPIARTDIGAPGINLPDGALSRLHDAVDRLHAALVDMEAEAQRNMGLA